MVNDAELTEFCRARAIEMVGEEFVHDLPMRMTAEDFAYYTHEVPGCFYRLGVANEEKGIKSPVHTPTFDVDDLALQVGPALMAYIAISRLGDSIT